jgi:DNA-binding LytR/AlgR family response regulator
MKVLIVEDETLSAERLVLLLQKGWGSVDILAVQETVEDTVLWLQNNPAPDLIFLDIHLADQICFEIFEHVEVQSPVIFTTAYDQYAIQAFKHNSIDYLLKPLNPSDLSQAMDKYFTLHGTPSDPKKKGMEWFKMAWQQMQEGYQGKQDYKKRFLVKKGSVLESISVEDVAYFYAEDKLVFLRTIEGKDHILEYSLEQLTDVLNPQDFFRINRKFLVRVESVYKVYSTQNSRLKLDLTPTYYEDIFVSRDRVSDFKQWFDS